MTRHVTVAEAAARLPELLTEVEAGESVTITRDGRAVAQIGPAPAKRRVPGSFRGNPDWDNFVVPPDLFAPMTEEEARAEGWP